MSLGGSPKPPTPVDPRTIIQAQEQANRIDRVTPFGSQTYNGNQLVTTLPQGTQNAFNNISDLGGHQQQFLQRPQGFGNLQDALMNRVSQRYQQPQQKPQQPMGQPGVGGGMGQSINGVNVNPAWGQALNTIWNRPQ